MDTADATPFGAWASIRGYFTPATLFLAVNLVIGTIALTSRSHQRRRREYHDDGHHQEPLHPHQQQQEYHYYHHQQPGYATPPPAPAPLARTSSVLDRLRSIGLYRFRSGDFPPEYNAAAAAGGVNHDVFAPVEEETTSQAHYARSRSEPAPAREEKRAAAPRVKKSGTEVRKAQVARAPASRVVEAVAEDETVDARAEEFTVRSLRREPSPQPEHHYYQEEYVPPPAPLRAPAPLARTSSVLDRLRSLGLYAFLGPEQPAAASTPARDGFATPVEEEKKQAHAHAHYDRSRSEPALEPGKKEKKQVADARMAKSSSTARKAAAPSLAEEDCVDARAEAFIDSFRREQSQKQVHHDQEEYVAPPPAPAPLARTSSVLDRLRSFSLYLRSSDIGREHPAADSTPAADEKKQAQYGRSRSEAQREHGKEKKKQGLSKSSSEAGVVEGAQANECVDARADDFINKFRKQLQLQRLNSLLGGKQQQ